MFLGEHEYTVDDKGRLAIPARFREELGEGVIITRGFDKCLYGFPRPFWELLAQQVTSVGFAQTDARQVQRLLFSGAAELTFDRQGRVLLPNNLRQFAELGDQAVVTGLNRYFEIWAPERWNQQLEAMDTNAALFAQQLATLNV